MTAIVGVPASTAFNLMNREQRGPTTTIESQQLTAKVVGALRKLPSSNILFAQAETPTTASSNNSNQPR